MSKFKPIRSSNLEAAAYDPATRELVIKFRSGNAYRYDGVSPELYKEFEETFQGQDGRSAGSFHAKRIRFLPNEQIEVEDEA